ncbi:hypothetical protein [Oceanobacillus sp. ISL-73]|nr:hypothetical protein [Oceanobacillus sp. ISL-73]
MNKEVVGKCKICGGNVYCSGGFLEGVLQDNNTLLCLSCSGRDKKD